jgi:probable rRNA maturation factor
MNLWVRLKQKLKLQIHAAVGRGYVRFLRAQLTAAHGILNPPLQQLSLALVDSREMRRLHAKFLGNASVTDVLTFPLEMDGKGRAQSGEVIICPAVAGHEARRRKTGVREELLLYALHGMLHLCGFDDRTAAGFKAMHAKEDEILTKLGVGGVFAPGRSRS